MLVIALSVLKSAREALVVTTPALLLSNLHRAWLLRAAIDRRTAAAFALGAVPFAIVGGLVVPAIPERALSILLVASTLLVLARSRGLVTIRAHRGMVAPAGAAIGALAATAGGAGMLVGPLYLSLGLSGVAYVGTVAISAVALHLGRVVGYGVSGVLTIADLPSAAALLAGLILGNLVAHRLRGRLSPAAEGRIEVASLSLATILAVLGVAR